jgi:chromosomal replication initiation ATPase DnaA
VNAAVERARAAIETMRQSYGQFLLDAGRAIDAIEFASAQAAPPVIDDARVHRVIAVVAADYDVAADLLLCPVRTRRISEARHVAMVMCRQLLELSQVEIGHAFRKDHGCVVNAERNVRNWLDTDHAFKTRYQRLKGLCTTAIGQPKVA